MDISFAKAESELLEHLGLFGIVPCIDGLPFRDLLFTPGDVDRFLLSKQCSLSKEEIPSFVEMRDRLHDTYESIVSLVLQVDSDAFERSAIHLCDGGCIHFVFGYAKSPMIQSFGDAVERAVSAVHFSFVSKGVAVGLLQYLPSLDLPLSKWELENPQQAHCLDMR